MKDPISDIPEINLWGAVLETLAIDAKGARNRNHANYILDLARSEWIGELCLIVNLDHKKFVNLLEREIEKQLSPRS